MNCTYKQPYVICKTVATKQVRRHWSSKVYNNVCALTLGKGYWYGDPSTRVYLKIQRYRGNQPLCNSQVEVVHKLKIDTSYFGCKDKKYTV